MMNIIHGHSHLIHGSSVLFGLHIGIPTVYVTKSSDLQMTVTMYYMYRHKRMPWLKNRHRMIAWVRWFCAKNRLSYIIDICQDLSQGAKPAYLYGSAPNMPPHIQFFAIAITPYTESHILIAWENMSVLWAGSYTDTDVLFHVFQMAVLYIHPSVSFVCDGRKSKSLSIHQTM